MAETSPDLPRECWELIFTHLNHPSHLSPLSLVSKQLLHITNRLLLSLTLSHNPPPLLLSRLLHRFQSLQHITLSSSSSSINPLLHRISLSLLPLQSLNISSLPTFPSNGLKSLSSRIHTLTSLHCRGVASLNDSHLALIAESFPLLNELDISYPQTWNPVSNLGVLSLALGLKALRRINLSGNHFVTDMGLVHLGKHCVFLTQVVMYECEFVTRHGVAKLIRASASLCSVLCGGVAGLSFGCAWNTAEALCVVDLSEMLVSDELLCLLAEACFPLKKLVLSGCENYSFAGLTVLVRGYPFLEYLDLERAYFLTDDDVLVLSEFLGTVTYVNLSYCHGITGVALCAIARNCRDLKEIKMVGTNAGAEVLEMDVVPNLGVKSVNLAENRLMGNGFLAYYVSFFPNLEMLDLSGCVNITEEGIIEVLKRCSGIRHLEISRCGLTENLLINFELPKLEVLCARGLIIDDDGLTIIGKRCPRLLILDVTACMEVTAKGVKEVVANCKDIREIRLILCTKFSCDAIPWLLLGRPSLKKIVILPSASFGSVTRNN